MNLTLTPSDFSQPEKCARLKTRLSQVLFVFCSVLAFKAAAVTFTPLPPFLAETKGAPMVMLNMSKDHQLFYKAYNEYSDLDDDGIVETQYKHSYKYYGYFDNNRCYNYDTTNNRYVPIGKVDATGYCTDANVLNRWNGNFMNWATMTRMDVVRRILYGGFRAVDTTSAATPSVSVTVLERAHLPSDAHAFAKYYYGTDVNKLTPFNPAATNFTVYTGVGAATATVAAQQITLCNVSYGNAQAPATTNDDAPSILVAEGNHSLWSANERWQCYWRERKDASNGNNPALTGLDASNRNPRRTTSGADLGRALGTGYDAGSYTARVEVCKDGITGGFTTDEVDRCKLYPRGNYKPVGLLQKYGEKNEAAFGLMTGSYDKNISGGVLRKNVASFTDEVDIDDGQFKNVDGIVRALNRIKVTGYDYGNGTYEGLVGGCNYQQIGLTDGQCRSWGNPLGEMYLESLRYFAGKTASADFTTAGAPFDTALGLTVTAWTDVAATSTVADFGDRLCRRNNIVNFNASVTSFDSNQWTGAGDISGLSTTIVNSYTNQIGAAEGLYAAGKLWSIGNNGVDTNGFCSDKAITATGASSFSSVTGVCPEAPTQGGGYKMAGAALWAKTNPVRTDYTIPASNKRAFRVDTYGVALATGTPRIKIPVPGQAGKFVFISPAYRLSVGAGGGGTLVDFKVVYQNATAGKYVINWEDSEQGGDFDQDVLGILEYRVNTATSVISVTTDVVAQATGNPQGFGYAITGTNAKDGVHFHSGIFGFQYVDPRNITVTPTVSLGASGGCNNCQEANAATTAVYNMLGVTAGELKDPLWYAAKYGGFDTDKTATYTLGAALPVAAWDQKKADGTAGSDGIPDNYFYAIDPAQLERSLGQVFVTILNAGGSAPAASPARVNLAGYIYSSSQSIKAPTTTNDADASGKFQRYTLASDGSVSSVADWDAGIKLTLQNWDTARKIVSLASSGPIPFRWASLPATEQMALRKSQTNATSYSNATKGEERLNWLRGDSTNEIASGGLRARPTTKLGAIINSTPWYVGPPSAGYSNTAYGGGYSTFVNNNTATNAVFVGANDGMLHAIDGSTGNELFAYVPRALYVTTSVAPFSRLSALSEKDFALGSGTGRLTVDGSLMAADMKVGTTPAWATYLFGSFGRGGKGVYALDITKPQLVDESNTQITKLVKWEFSEATGDPDMGFITGRATSRPNGQPFQTGMMANGKWAAIYGNGYNSTNGNAVLYILFADGPSASTTTWTTGTHYIKIPTGTAGNGPDNGLAMPTAVDSNNDGIIDTIYAGDLKGNVWKFDVSSATASNWKLSTTGNVPVYQAKSTLTGSTTVVVQPITTVIQPFPHPNGGYQLVFSTGKSLESNDYPMSAPYGNTIYGIYDKPGNTTTLTVGKSELLLKSTTFVAGFRYYEVSSVDYSTQKGWYSDLPLPSEGTVFNPFARSGGYLAVSSLAPDGISDGCRVDSVSFSVDLDAINGNARPLGRDISIVTGFIQGSYPKSNEFEKAPIGSITRVRTELRPPGECVAGNPNILINPDNPAQCILCADLAKCCPPWKRCDICMENSGGQGGSGVSTDPKFGSCGDTRLTWREIIRNR